MFWQVQNVDDLKQNCAQHAPVVWDICIVPTSSVKTTLLHFQFLTEKIKKPRRIMMTTFHFCLCFYIRRKNDVKTGLRAAVKARQWSRLFNGQGSSVVKARQWSRLVVVYFVVFFLHTCNFGLYIRPGHFWIPPCKIENKIKLGLLFETRHILITRTCQSITHFYC